MGRDDLVLLVNPPCPASIQNKQFVLPSSLLYLGGHLRANGFPTVLLDYNTFRPWEVTPECPESVRPERILDWVEQHNPCLVGISCLFSGQFSIVKDYARLLKTQYPDLPIVIGGMHPTIFAEEILEGVPEIDYVIIGEGEEQLLSLAHHLQGQAPHDLKCLGGFAWRLNDGSVAVNPKVDFIDDLDSLPFQDYDLVRLKDYYHDTSHWHNPKNLPIGISIPLISSRSCPMKCNFCSMFLIGGSRFRCRSAANVCEEIRMLYEKHSVRHFTFMDDNLTLNKKRAIDICSGIVSMGMDIQIDTPNGLMVNSLDDEVIDALASAGWVRGAIAIESGSEHIRNTIIKKNLKLERILEVIQSIRRYPQVYLKAYFLMGFPEDTPETLQASYDLIEQLDIDDPYMTNVVPFPGTRLFEQCLKDGLFVDAVDPKNIWQDCDFFMTNKSRFYIRPYEMEVSDLHEWRERFDELIRKKLASNRRSS